MRGGAVLRCRFDCPQPATRWRLWEPRAGQKDAATIDRREFIDAVNRLGLNPQVIEKDLVLVLASAD